MCDSNNDKLHTDYPHEFLGRCATCLDNAYLSSEPCRPMMGVNGAPLSEDDCPIYRARKVHDTYMKRKDTLYKWLDAYISEDDFELDRVTFLRFVADRINVDLDAEEDRRV